MVPEGYEVNDSGSASYFASSQGRFGRSMLGRAQERWLHHFRAGMDAADLTPEQDARLWDYVTHAAQFMVNSFEQPT